TECPRYGDCFLTLMRQRAAESDVVIVNHHLLCADASVRQRAYGAVIFCSALSLARAASATMADARARYTSEAMADCAEDGLMLVGALEELERALVDRDSGLPGRRSASRDGGGARDSGRVHDSEFEDG